eukprot:CAMPEP_0117577148 /NCGR_PEP_ID=MMETSP0784-20121206/63241_1 /TAXON_ID=39447 /ORGANISM="" /LENGTH=978 /DNA_ID=CAMNT_0005376577 /DNA_START=37 /DNA_END=2973 /DNA_ORIENTATION=+
MAELLAAAGAFVATAVAPKLTTAGLGARASQIHAHKMDEIRFRIESQKLQRQDIRDLTNMGRMSMDTYQKVGTLLLAFTCGLFGGSMAYASMFNPKSTADTWLVTLFAMSAVTAIGYLCLAVWLAMHAVVISDSVAARLLICFQRLSIPGRRELDTIRTPLVPLPPIQGLTKAARKRFKRFRNKDDEKTGAEAAGDIEHQFVERETAEHFKRYEEEQTKFIKYDEFARISMGLGVNHLLMTISWFVQAVVVPRSLVGGFVIILALGVLMIIILRIDLADDIGHRTLKIFVVWTMMLGSPLLAFMDHWIKSHFIQNICMLLGALWLVGVYYFVKWDKGAKMPSMIRTTRYMKVVDKDSEKLTDARIQKCVADHVETLRRLRGQLRGAIKSVIRFEQENGGNWSSRRSSDSLMRLRAKLADKLGAAFLDTPMETSNELLVEIRKTETTLMHFQIWQQAPDVYAGLSGLRSKPVAQYLAQDEREQATQKYMDFILRCEGLDLGFPEEARHRTRSATIDTGLTSSYGTSSLDVQKAQLFKAPSRSKAKKSVTFDQTEESETELQLAFAGPDAVPMPIVYVNDDTQSSSLRALWIDSQTGEVHHKKPCDTRLTDPKQILDASAEWLQGSRALEGLFSEMLSETSADIESSNASEDNLSQETSYQTEEQVPNFTSARAPGWLPRVIVQWFTLGLALLRLAALLLNVVIFMTGHDETAAMPKASLLSRPVLAELPEPSSGFEIAALHCSGPLVLIRSRFMLHSAHRPASPGHYQVTGLARVDVQAANALCGARGCGTLALLGGNTTMELAQVRSTTTFGSQPSKTWRFTAAERLPCEPAPCESARLAGWDGEHVIIASAFRDAPTQAWRVKPRFALNPPFGVYDHVVALQLRAQGHTLMVLSPSGALDGWNLTSGVLLGRWRVNGMPTAMCDSGSDLLIAQRGEEEPFLEVVDLPLELVERHAGELGAGPAEHRSAEPRRSWFTV